jgi:hypothetical protein
MILLNISAVVFVMVCIGGLYWRYRYTQQVANTIKKSGCHAVAIVRDYQKEYVRVAGSWHWLDYPYVTYENAEGELVYERLKYAENSQRLLEIGEEIEVVRYDGILYCRAALHPNYEWSYIGWLAATVGALAAIGGLASYFTVDK